MDQQRARSAIRPPVLISSLRSQWRGGWLVLAPAHRRQVAHNTQHATRNTQHSRH